MKKENIAADVIKEIKWAESRGKIDAMIVIYQRFDKKLNRRIATRLIRGYTHEGVVCELETQKIRYLNSVLAQFGKVSE